MPRSFGPLTFRLRPPTASQCAAAIALLCASAAAIAQQAPADVEAKLIEQGRYWQTRQADRAVEVWKKLLLIEPDNAEALMRLGRLAVDAKRTAEASGYLARLRRAHPDSAEARELEQDITVGSAAGASDLDQARILVREQKLDEAAVHYRRLFGGRQPQGRLAVEYYSMLGYTPNGRAEGVAGLERMLRVFPGDPQIQLALANLRLQQTDTRLGALRNLATLSRRQDIGGEATEQWRGALGWLGSPPPAAYQGLFREYLAANPDDKEIRDQLAGRGKKLPGMDKVGVRPPLDPVSARIAAGYAALQANDLPRAEAEFQAALKARPGSGPALGGVGLIRLKQQQFSTARDYLGRASRADGEARWKQSLDGATYWDLVQQATTARSTGRLDEARRKLEQAIKIDGKEATAENALAAVYSDQKRPTEAERLYRDVLLRQPDNLDALRGLVGTLAATGRTDEALAMIDALTPEQRAKIDVDGLRAEQYVGEAHAALAQGDTAGARSRLQAAVDFAPDNPWTRLELARLDLQAGAASEAQALMDALLARRPNDPEALYANALYAGELQDWPASVQLMERIPPASRTPAMYGWQRRAAVRVMTSQAVALAEAGRGDEARQLLARAAAGVGDEADLLGLVAQAYVDIGDSPRAGEMLRSAIARAGGPGKAGTVALQLQYGDILLRANDDAGLAALLRQMQPQVAALDADDRIRVETLRRAYVLRQAESLRTQGRLAAGYELLRPLLADTPQDPALLGLLARMYVDAGQPEQAARIYRQLLDQKPDDVNTLLAVGALASSQGEYGYAEQVMRRAQELQPQNPEVLAGLGRLYRAQGKNGQAVALLKQAVAAATRNDPAALVAVAQPPQDTALSFASPDNPFVRFNASRAAPAAQAITPPAGRPALSVLPAIPTFATPAVRPSW